MAINLTIGQNGIFYRAQVAVNVWGQAATNEQNELGIGADIIDEYLNMNVKTLVQAYKDGEIKIGDYVNYKNPTTGTYISYKEKNGLADQTFNVDETTQWRVLGLSEDGNHLLLTTSSPIKRDEASNPNTDWGVTEEVVNEINNDYYFYMYGHFGAYYGVEELNNICSIYKNELAEECRSINVEDINKILNLVVLDEENPGVYKKEDIEKNDYSNNLDITYSLSKRFIFRENIDWTPESLLQISDIPDEYYNEGILGTGYMYRYNDYELNLASRIPQVIYDTLLKGTENYDDKIYWLANKGIRLQGDSVLFGIGGVNDGYVSNYSRLQYSTGTRGNEGMGIKPIVVLKSKANVNDIQVIEGKEDDEWPEHQTDFGMPR